MSKKIIGLVSLFVVIIGIGLLFFFKIIPLPFSGSSNQNSTQAPASKNSSSPELSVQENLVTASPEPVAYTDRMDCATLTINTNNNSSINSSDTYTTCTITTSNCDSSYVLSDAAAGIRLRGNSTKQFNKKPYRIKFNDAVQLLGLSTGKSKSWVLLAAYCDYSLLRDAITFNLANRLSGITFAPDCAFVNVILNGTAQGVYLLTEQPQVGTNRLNIDKSGAKDTSITDTGYLLELEADSSRRNEEGAENNAWLAVDGYASYSSNTSFRHSDSYDVAFYVVKSDAKSPAQISYIKDYLIKVYDAVYKSKDQSTITSLIDIDTAVDMYLLQLICNDYDNNYSSAYIYKDKGGKLCFGMPWDFDLSYGNYRGHNESEGTVYMYHLLKTLGEFDWFKKLCSDRWSTISSGASSPVGHMLASIHDYYGSQTLLEHFNANYSLTYGSSSGDSNSFINNGRSNRGWQMHGGGGNLGTRYNTPAEAATGLYTWLDARITWIGTFLR